MTETNRMYPDLVKALAEMKNPKQHATAEIITKTGGKYTYTYATLDDLLNMARPILAKHNLAITQDVSSNETDISIETVIIHSSGEWKSSGPFYIGIEERVESKDGSVIYKPLSPQAIGSLISYIRRYQLTAFLGVAGEQDDDAQIAETPKKVAEKAAKEFSGEILKEEVSTDEMRENVKAWLHDLAEGDPTLGADILEQQTQFENKKGELIRGKRDINKVSERQMPVLYGRIKKMYQDWAGIDETP